MADEKTIDFILNTYELSSILKNKIRRIALVRTYELFINGFDNTYEYLANLIDKFHVRRALSLDAVIRDGNGKTFHEFTAIEDKGIENLFDMQIDPQESMSLTDAIHFLENRLDYVDFEILKQLFLVSKNKGGAMDINITPEMMMSGVEEIQGKLKQVAEIYGKDGKIIIPRRPIFHIDFNPLSIKFARRYYKGDPLKFFRENLDVYGEMGRSELSKFDSGLYYALRKSSQLVEAIPFTKIRDLSNPLKIFFETYKNKTATMTRMELKKEDKQLYRALCEKKLLNQAISQTRNRFNENPLDYFNKNIENYRGMSRSDLHKADAGLYDLLRQKNQLKEAIPTTLRRNYAGNPLLYFEECRYYDLSRGQLKKKDEALFAALKRSGQLNEAIPKKSK